MMQLTNNQLLFLKNLAHPLTATVLIGANGLTESVLSEIEVTLLHHELIKIKINAQDRDTRQHIAATIVERLSAAKVQIIGKVVVIYRPSKEKKINLPRR